MAHINNFNVKSIDKAINQAFMEAVESLFQYDHYEGIIEDYERKNVHYDVLRILGMNRARNPHLFYYTGDMNDLTLAGRLLAIAHVSWDYTSDYQFEIDNWDAFYGRPAGTEWSQSYGSPAYGYATLFPAVPELRVEDVAAIRCYARKKVETLIEEHNRKIRASRKEYGRQINAELSEGGLNQKAINAYWRMQWRNECPPTAFVECVRDDNIPWHIVASAESWSVIDKAGADQLQMSVPRIVDLARAVCKARGERPASYKEVVKFLHSYNTASEDYEQPRLADVVA